MSDPTPSTSTTDPRQPFSAPAELFCHRCGYDLRVQPVDGVCPECATPVADSVRIGAIPCRPAWRDSDPRWRRRLLIGLWLLVLLPVVRMVPLEIPIPTLFDYRGVVQTLADTEFPRIAADILFCVGIVLLFSRERFRRPHLLDRTRSIGVIGAYAITAIVFSRIVFIWALVAAGMGAVFLSIPLQHQPSFTLRWVEVCYLVLHYGPHPLNGATFTLITGSATVVGLACIPLYLALRSTTRPVVALLLISPLGLAVAHQLSVAAANLLYIISYDAIYPSPFYVPDQVGDALQTLAGYPSARAGRGGNLGTFAHLGDSRTVELLKWLALLIPTLWLTAAQLRTWLPGSRRTLDPAA